MLRKVFIGCLVFCCAVASVSAHDLFLKLDTYFLRPNSTATVRLFSGTFYNSEGPVRRARMNDVSVVAPGGAVSRPPEAASRDLAKMSLLNVETGEAGTYVAGISTKPREINLKAAAFNEYLAHDGIPDTLAQRKQNNELKKDVRERYSKHVRAVFQVGERHTDNYKRPLGYPVEIIPQQNPYQLGVGQTIEVLCTLDGKPIPNQFVMAGWEAKRRSKRPLTARTNANGIARFELSAAGKWYIKMIHMTPLNEPGVDYESKWASLTFEVK